MTLDEIATKADLLALDEKLTRIEFTLSAIAGIKPDDDELLDRQDAAKMLRVSLPTLSAMTNEGRIKGYRAGRQIRYKRRDLLKSLEVIKTNQYKR